MSIYHLVFQPVDFSWNKHADKNFQFNDHFLVATIRSKKDPQMLEFFKLLSLCHTVMVEQKDGESTTMYLKHAGFMLHTVTDI